jgi:hypothetical protein
MQRAAIRPEGAEPGTNEPAVLEPSVEVTCPPGDGAGAGAAAARGPAGVGEDIEMAETHEPTVIKPSVEATHPPGDGAGAGATGAGGPARVGEDVEMGDGEDGSSNLFATFIQPTNQEEYSETSTDAGSIYSPSDEK